MPTACAISNCANINYDTSKYTSDWGEVRYYCDEHWRLVSKFFSRVAGGNCSECKRNHHAETNSVYSDESTVKYDNRHWDLCNGHLKTYEDAIDYFASYHTPED